MTEIRFESSGLKELTDMLTDLAPRSANNVMRNAVTDLARDVRDEMKKRAPQKSGDLAKAIKAQRRRGKQGVLESSVTITHGDGQRYDAFYWHFVEFGTVKMRAQPYITPATESIRPQVPKLMREHFGVRLEKELTRLAKKKAVK